MDPYIVRIVTNKESGSGVIYFPADKMEEVFILTSRHLLVSEVDDNRVASVKIEFFDANNTWLVISSDDQVVLGDNSETEDFAVIICHKNKIPASIEAKHAFSAAIITGREKIWSVNGLPIAADNREQISLFKLAYLTDKTFENEIQLELSDPITEAYNADTLVEGYSGSPLFISDGSTRYIAGIFTDYHANTKRIWGIDLKAVNKVLQKGGRSGLNLRFVETDPEILSDLSKLRSNSKRVLARIRNKIGDFSLPRTISKEKLTDMIRSTPFVLVRGRAGTGKSALTKEVICALEDKFEIIALQGEQLDRDNIRSIFSEQSIGLQGDFEHLLDSPGMKPAKIILLDSIEKLLETPNGDTILDFLNLLQKRADVKLVLTCRSYAIEQLRIRFLRQIPFVADFEVPILSGEELELIGLQYPFLKLLFGKESLIKILRIPFNLDKAVFIGDKELVEDLNFEADFKRLAWEYIVENMQNESNPDMRKKRGEIFQLIAIRRAEKMAAYISVPEDTNALVIQKLLQDDLIHRDPAGLNRYAVSHDIYEDWALTRFIEMMYNEIILAGDSVTKFFSSIGFAPAIRRGFRIWVSEKIEKPEYNTTEFIQKVLVDEETLRYWKDEILVAVLQSAYSKDFLESFRKLLFNNDFYFFRRALLLLNVACQAPDQNHNSHRNEMLRPEGEGWPNMINFIFAHSDELKGECRRIIPLILQWGKLVAADLPLPVESANAGRIILKTFQIYRDQVRNEESGKKVYVKETIPLLFQLASVLRNEITQLIDNTLSKEEENAGYQIRNFKKDVIKCVLSWSESAILCREIPEVVIRVAEKLWFYYPPSAEQVAEYLKGTPFKSMPREIEKEEQFGVVSEFVRSYFPASAYQTPVITLLACAPKKTLSFITRLFNHSANAFWDSDFLKEDFSVMKADKRYEIEYKLADGHTVRQYGSLTLWLIYRGTHIATPYLLQSVLMALETWLLNLAAFVEKDKESKFPIKKKCLDYAIDHLLRESNSVATSAVLVSLGLAHPDLVGPEILPLFRVKEFYYWDLFRMLQDPSALAPYDEIHGGLLQRERIQSRNLPHRKSHLEKLVLQLSFGNLSAEILRIIDHFNAEEPKEQAWKFALNRMDRRKLKVVKEVDNGYLVETEIDEELKQTVEKTQALHEELAPLTEASNWANKKLKNEPVDIDNFDEWQKHFNNISHVTIVDESLKLYHNPALLAAIGLRDYFEELKEKEMKWSLERIFAIVEYELKKSDNQYDLNFPFGVFETDAAFISLIEIINRSQGDELMKAKELTFLSLIFDHYNLEREDLIKKIKDSLWLHSPKFALCCLIGLIEYSKIAGLRLEIAQSIQFSQQINMRDVKPETQGAHNNRFINKLRKLFSKNKRQTSSSSKLAEIEDLDFQKNEFQSKFDLIMNAVLNETIGLQVENVLTDENEPYILIEALDLVPADTRDKRLLDYYSIMIRYIITHLDSENRFGQDKIHFDQLMKFEKCFASLLLCQPQPIAISKFGECIDDVFQPGWIYNAKRIELIEGILEAILSQTGNNEKLFNNFWALWDYLSIKNQQSVSKTFEEYLLLDGDRINLGNEWKGIFGKKYFFESVIRHSDLLKSIVRLISGVGYRELLPEAILWLSELLTSHSLAEKYEVLYSEKLVERVFYDKVMKATIRNNHSLRIAFISVLDALIDQSSASAFLIRDDFISLGK